MTNYPKGEGNLEGKQYPDGTNNGESNIPGSGDLKNEEPPKIWENPNISKAYEQARYIEHVAEILTM